VWALGLIAIQLLSGQVYWRANTVGELMAHILAEPLYAPSERWPWLPRALDEWFARSCARDPKQRFQSAGEQIAALDAVLAAGGSMSDTRLESPSAVSGNSPMVAGGRTTSATTAEREAPKAQSGSRGLLVAGGAIGVIGMLAGAFLLGRARGPAQPHAPLDSGAATDSLARTAPADSAIATDASAERWNARDAQAATPAVGQKKNPADDCAPDELRCSGHREEYCMMGHWMPRLPVAGKCGAVCSFPTNACDRNGPTMCGGDGEWVKFGACQKGKTCRDGKCEP